MTAGTRPRVELSDAQLLRRLGELRDVVANSTSEIWRIEAELRRRRDLHDVDLQSFLDAKEESGRTA